jgi:hypothetical protein
MQAIHESEVDDSYVAKNVLFFNMKHRQDGSGSSEYCCMQAHSKWIFSCVSCYYGFGLRVSLVFQCEVCFDVCTQDGPLRRTCAYRNIFYSSTPVSGTPQHRKSTSAGAVSAFNAKKMFEQVLFPQYLLLYCILGLGNSALITCWMIKLSFYYLPCVYS